MIERVFDHLLLDPPGRSSVLEAGLHAWLNTARLTTVERLSGPIFELATDAARHGSGRLEQELAAAAGGDAGGPGGGGPDGDDGGREARLGSLRRLLETGAGHLRAGRAARRERCRQAALEFRALAAFARCRPAAALDRAAHEVGAAAAASRAARPEALTEVSEWAVDEVMAEYRLPKRTAQNRLALAVVLAEQLPATLDALEAGLLTEAHAVMLADELGVLDDPANRARVEAELLARAAGATVPALREAARRAVLRADAQAAARRLARAIRRRHVRVSPGRDGEGSLGVDGLPLPVLLACKQALQAYAQACATPDDPRTQDQRMADCLVDLILRPDAGHPPVQLALTVIAGTGTLAGGDQPGQIDGHPVPATLIRELLHTLGLGPRTDPRLPVEDDETPDQPAADDTTDTGAGADTHSDSDPAVDAPVGGETDAPADQAHPDEVDDAVNGERGAEETADEETAEAADAEAPAGLDATADGESGADETTTPAAAGSSTPQQAPGWLSQLLDLRTVAGTALKHLPTIAVVDEISGQLLALTNAAELQRGQPLGPPAATDGYTPSQPLQKFIRARDRRCRFPGCRTPATRCDLDHNQPWPLGPTSADNLCCLCRHHHRLSHQAPGWDMRRLDDGGLEWTTPGGTILTTYPPPYGTDDPPPAPAKPANPEPPPRTLRDRILGRPATDEDRRDDPAPF